jgi:hypothetical protein
VEPTAIQILFDALIQAFAVFAGVGTVFSVLFGVRRLIGQRSIDKLGDYVSLGFVFGGALGLLAAVYAFTIYYP